MNTFELGPKQKIWIEALKSGKYAQAKEVLVDDKEKQGAFCCLGVANKVCNLGENWDHADLQDTYVDLGLYSSSGSVSNRTYEEGLYSLVELNDDRGYDFEQIAEVLEKNASRYFKESK